MRTEVVYFGMGFSVASAILRVAFLEAGLSDDFAILLQFIGFIVAIIGAIVPKRCPTWEEAKRWGRG